MAKKYRVDIIESERGWGQRIDGHKYFKSLKEANKFVKEYNKENDSLQVPNWYMYAAEPVVEE